MQSPGVYAILKPAIPFYKHLIPTFAMRHRKLVQMMFNLGFPGELLEKMRIFIACADKNLRIAMLLFLDYEPGMMVVGITDRLAGLPPQLEALQPDVLLLEWELSYQSIEKLLTDIHKLEHSPKVIFLSDKPEEQEKMLAAGADYFIVKNAPPDQLLPILNQIRRTTDDRLHQTKPV